MKNFLLTLLLLLFITILCSCNDAKQNEIDELQCQLSLMELEIAERDMQIKTLEDRIDALSDEIANNELAKIEYKGQAIGLKYNLTELSRKAKELYVETEREYVRRGLLASIAESINDISELAKKQAEAILAATMDTDDY